MTEMTHRTRFPASGQCGRWPRAASSPRFSHDFAASSISNPHFCTDLREKTKQTRTDYSAGGRPFRSSGRRALTLVEIMVVVAIIAILVAVVALVGRNADR